jgi:hypothetical protein
MWRIPIPLVDHWKEKFRGRQDKHSGATGGEGQVTVTVDAIAQLKTKDDWEQSARYSKNSP